MTIRIEMLSGLLRHRRAVVLGALVTVTVAAWAYLLLAAGMGMDMDGGSKTVAPSAWSPPYAVLISLMWWAMLFASGYLLVWSGVSLAATLLQWRLENAGLLSETMAFGGILASTVLVAAGLYQWTPLKDACLRHCRSPTES